MPASSVVRWYEHVPSAPRPSSGAPARTRPSKTTVSSALVRAETSLSSLSRRVGSSASSSSDSRWLSRIQSGGTLSDRVASLSLLVQSDPLRSGLTALGTLVSMARKKSRAESDAAISCLRDLFSGSLVPPGRTLIFFFDRPLRSGEEMGVEGGGDAEEYLEAEGWWFFEDRIKRCFGEFLDCVEAAASDSSVEHHKELGMSVVRTLLDSGCREGEGRMTSMLVNKLGDRSRSVCGRVSTWLSRLVADRKIDKRMLADEVERLLYRRNVPKRAQFYGIVLLSQILLSRGDREFAGRLVSLYLAFFKALTDREGEEESSDSRLLSSLMSGVHRALPYAGLDATDVGKHADSLFLLARTATLNKAVQALQLLLQFITASATSSALADRFYAALYERTMSIDILAGLRSSRLSLYFNLVFKSLKRDTSADRCASFLKRLLQLCCASPHVSFVCGCLLMLSHLLSVKPQLRALLDPQTSSDEGGSCPVVPTSSDMSRFDDGEDDGESSAPADTAAPAPAPAATTSSGLNVCDVRARDGEHAEGTLRYLPLKRDPRYTNALKSCLWELDVLRGHYHPTVVKFAEALLGAGPRVRPIDYAGDPVKNFTLMAFLEKFVLKNAKKTGGAGGDDQRKGGESASRKVLVREDEEFVREFQKLKEEQTRGKREKREKAEKLKKRREKERAKEDDLSEYSYSDLEDAIREEEDDFTADYTGRSFEDPEFLDDDDMDDQNDLEEAAGVLDDEDDEDGEEGGEGEEGDDEGGQGKKKKKKDSMFADAEDFSELIDKGENEKEAAWEEGQRKRSFPKKSGSSRGRGRPVAKRARR